MKINLIFIGFMIALVFPVMILMKLPVFTLMVVSGLMKLNGQIVQIITLHLIALGQMKMEVIVIGLGIAPNGKILVAEVLFNLILAIAKNQNVF